MGKFNTMEMAQALEGRLAVRRYPFPGADGIECGVQMLTDGQMDTVRIDAANYCKTRKVDLNLDPDFLDRCIIRRTIFEAFVDPDNHAEKFFDTQEDVAQLDNVTVRALYELHIAHQQAMDPLAYVSREEVDALVAILGKSESSVETLTSFDRPTLLSCVLSMAFVLREKQQSRK